MNAVTDRRTDERAVTSTFLVNEVAVDLWSNTKTSLKKFLNRLRKYGNGYSMAIVLDHRSSALTETKIGEC